MTMEEQILNGFTEMMRGFWCNQDLKVPDIETPCEKDPYADWYDVPSDEMTLEQARQAVNGLRKKLAEYLEKEQCDEALEVETKEYGRIEVIIPYLMHKKMDIPISECQKAYDVAIDYLRSKANMKG